MITKATISSIWRNRQLMIAAFLTAFGLWFLYDGAIGYPWVNEQFAQYEEMKADGREAEWEAFSREKGWSAKPPKHGYEPGQIRIQFLLASLSITLGVCALGWLAICAKRNVAMDETSIYGDTGKEVTFDSIQGVDRRKWESKGIAYALYEAHGKMKRLTIDDYKYAGAEEILKEIESRLGIIEPKCEPTGESTSGS